MPGCGLWPGSADGTGDDSGACAASESSVDLPFRKVLSGLGDPLLSMRYSLTRYAPPKPMPKHIIAVAMVIITFATSDSPVAVATPLAVAETVAVAPVVVPATALLAAPTAAPPLAAPCEMASFSAVNAVP